MSTTHPRFPLYVVSKGRWQTRFTIDSLQQMGVDFNVVIEEQEYDQYASQIDKKHLVVLDPKYQDEYETCDDLGNTKSKGPGPARNFAWQHAIDNGHEWHWVMDDNIRGFYRLHNNKKRPIKAPGFWRAMEDFVLRYTNVAMAGPNYAMFAWKKAKYPPFIKGTRIYSCNLIRNDVPFKWRGRYNEDTIISLDMLKAKWQTIQFYAFLQNKVATQTIKGGNTEAFYAKEGTAPKSEMLAKVHPDVSRVTFRYSRIHHYVDYSKFRNMPLIKKPDADTPNEPNEYGITLKRMVDTSTVKKRKR